MKKFFYFILILFFTKDASAVEFQGKFIQGHFIIGKTESGTKVLIDKKEVRTSDDGYFVFGISRDRKYDVIITLNKDLVDSRTSKPSKIIEEKSVTLNKIIEDSPYRNSKINLLSVDIENHEYRALKNFNFLKYKVDVLVVESTDTSLKKLEMYNQSLDFITKSKIYNLIIKNGYKFVNWIHSDLVFVRNDFRQAE